MNEKTFRRDLFDLLGGTQLSLPPLRDRLDDIPRLCQYFVKELRGNEKEVEVLPDAICALQSHIWPGNVRELRNVIRSTVQICGDRAITPDDLPAYIRYEMEKTVTAPRPGVSLEHGHLPFVDRLRQPRARK